MSINVDWQAKRSYPIGAATAGATLMTIAARMAVKKWTIVKFGRVDMRCKACVRCVERRGSKVACTKKYRAQLKN